jgi:DNA-binding NarL/FixJ family response regulator
MATARILIVEDEGLVAEDIRETLVQLGYQIAGVVISGEQAVRLAAEIRPDLVLMDIRLQGKIQGIQAARLIGADLNIPIVYVTAQRDEATLRDANTTKPSGFVFKPFEEEKLQRAIENALRGSKPGGCD